MDNSYYIQSMLERKIKRFQIIVCVLGVIILGAVIENVVLVLNGNFDSGSKNNGDDQSQQVCAADDEKPDADEDGISDAYIYVPEWGIKIKKATKLQQFVYSLDMSKGNGILRVAAVLYDSSIYDFKNNSKPEFVKYMVNGMGTVSRVSAGSADSSLFENPDPIYEDDDYEFYYESPSKTYSEKDADKALEEASIEAIKKMLEENISAI